MKVKVWTSTKEKFHRSIIRLACLLVCWDAWSKNSMRGPPRSFLLQNNCFWKSRWHVLWKIFFYYISSSNNKLNSLPTTTHTAQQSWWFMINNPLRNTKPSQTTKVQIKSKWNQQMPGTINTTNWRLPWNAWRREFQRHWISLRANVPFLAMARDTGKSQVKSSSFVKSILLLKISNGIRFLSMK